MQDKLHQQYRKHMFPFEPIIKVALEAGAHGAYLSGAGPTVLAIAGGVGTANVGSDTMSQARASPRRPRRLRQGPHVPPTLCAGCHPPAPPTVAVPGGGCERGDDPGGG